jgi:membrane associated rhomboid family serine protease
MNSNNENESQNVNIEQNENIGQQNEQIRQKQKKKFKKTIIYPTFFFLFILNLSLYLYWKYYYIRLSYFSISLYPIINKYQFYRFLTHHFMHYGIFHFFVELLITFFVCKNLEKMIGTLLTFSIILIMMIMTSFLYFLTIFTFKLIVLIFNMNSNFDFMYECGMSSLLFSLYTYITQFKKNKDKFIKLLNLVAIKSRFSPFYILIVLTFFTPNKTFIGNLCGIISAYIIKSLFGYHVLPKYEGINDFEKFFKLNYCKCCYISIIEMNEDMKNNVMEIYTIININPTTNKQEELGIQMDEIQNTSINNRDNNETNENIISDNSEKNNLDNNNNSNNNDNENREINISEP